nr:MAG TPA: hypothetical protein [Caudoviricetes sp.]
MGRIQELIFEQDKRQRPIWWSVRNDRRLTPNVCDSHTYVGRCSCITNSYL